MSDKDDILAIVAALEFLTSRDETPPPKSRWKESASEPWPTWSRPERNRTWKNS